MNEIRMEDEPLQELEKMHLFMLGIYCVNEKKKLI
jgi:hypothetical protein